MLATKDPNHVRALTLLKEIAQGKYGRVYTSDYVLDESMTLISVRTKGEKTHLLIKMKDLFIGSGPIGQLIFIDSSWMEEIADLQIKLVKDGTLSSFTDCSSVVICQKRGIGNIISFDGHFEGFLTQIR